MRSGRGVQTANGVQAATISPMFTRIVTPRGRAAPSG